ncbi:hypothetical protein [Persicobacter sp. CCB-QB2]|uniref:hypothetical protein n=1 Tax=Persicobacter sp. CCB-QB2 TaxID=1561025 RepID=UPI0006A9D7DB|nr:hypothetical protein [Persicobacter sp. CCB-QB2]
MNFKMIVFLFCLPLILSCSVEQPKQEDQLKTLFHNTYKVYQLMRHENGLYYDYVHTEGGKGAGSSASIGMGLVAMCVGHEMGWEPKAEELIIQTLKSVLGEGAEGVALDRNAENCFIHFFDIETGAPVGSNYSPIDTDIMIGGALFAKQYFSDNPTIAYYADKMYSMVNHDIFIGDPAKGEIVLNLTKEGVPSPGRTLPYNEYMMVAWLAMNQEGNNGQAAKLWEQYYAKTSQMPATTYTSKKGEQFQVLTDVPNHFTSNFTFMFNYLFVHDFSNQEQYQEAMRQAALADRAWWHDRTELEEKGKQDYEWGTTAGMGLKLRNGEIQEGYTVDRICPTENINTQWDQNMGRNVAPSALAGYAPVLPDLVRADLLKMLQDERKIGQITLPKKEGISTGDEMVLWKYSYSDLNWKPKKIEGVDYACMLMGLASLPEFLGPEFFNQHNNFFE